MDYGHVGCASDVLDVADSRCSGRRQCQIRIPDALFGKTKPCPDDLKPYLEANYECLKGECTRREHTTRVHVQQCSFSSCRSSLRTVPQTPKLIWQQGHACGKLTELLKLTTVLSHQPHRSRPTHGP